MNQPMIVQNRSTAKEIFSIVLGVLLALGANALWQNRQQQKTVEIFVEAIKLEVLQNKEWVLEVLPYHQSVRDTLMFIQQDPARQEDFQFFDVWRGAGAPKIRDTAYETAVFSGVLPHMEYALASEITGVYRQQSELKFLFERYFAGALAGDPADQERFMGIASMMTVDVALAEERLIADYDALIELIENQ